MHLLDILKAFLQSHQIYFAPAIAAMTVRSSSIINGYYLKVTCVSSQFSSHHSFRDCITWRSQHVTTHLSSFVQRCQQDRSIRRAAMARRIFASVLFELSFCHLEPIEIEKTSGLWANLGKITMHPKLISILQPKNLYEIHRNPYKSHHFIAS